MKRIGQVIVEKLPVDDMVLEFDVRDHTEDKALGTVTISAVDNETGTPASVASIESFSGTIIKVRFTGGITQTNYKCTMVVTTVSPADTYYLEIMLHVVPWHRDAKQFDKQPGDNFVYAFDFCDVLGGSDDGAGNLITNLSVQAENHNNGDPANILTPAGINGSLGKIRIFGGTSGDVYKCTVIANGNTPTRTYGEVFFVNVIDL